jgi:hypothetical protein
MVSYAKLNSTFTTSDGWPIHRAGEVLLTLSDPYMHRGQHKIRSWLSAKIKRIDNWWREA